MPKKKCYYCGVELNKSNRSKEHIPPKILFSAFTCDSITVPSCIEHNSRKSNVDQAIVAGLMKSLYAGNYLLTQNVIEAIELANKNSTFQTTKRTALLKSILDKPSLHYAHLNRLPHVAYVQLPLDSWIKKITAGLIYNGTNRYNPEIDWDDAIFYSPSWYASPANGLTEEDVINLAKKKLDMQMIWESVDWENGWSSFPRPYPPDIYRFHIYFAKPILFKHIFFNSFTMYIGIECDNYTKELLKKKVFKANN